MHRTALSLQLLPIEILEMIAEITFESDEDDYTMLRLRSTCRGIQAATRSIWLASYIKHRSIVLEQAKLEELAAIAEVRELADSVTKIRVFCKEAKDPPSLRVSTEHNYSGSISYLRGSIERQRLVFGL